MKKLTNPIDILMDMAEKSGYEIDHNAFSVLRNICNEMVKNKDCYSPAISENKRRRINNSQHAEFPLTPNGIPVSGLLYDDHSTYYAISAHTGEPFAIDLTVFNYLKEQFDKLDDIINQ